MVVVEYMLAGHKYSYWVDGFIPTSIKIQRLCQSLRKKYDPDAISESFNRCFLDIFWDNIQAYDKQKHEIDFFFLDLHQLDLVSDLSVGYLNPPSGEKDGPLYRGIMTMSDEMSYPLVKKGMRNTLRESGFRVRQKGYRDDVDVKFELHCLLGHLANCYDRPQDAVINYLNSLGIGGGTRRLAI